MGYQECYFTSVKETGRHSYTHDPEIFDEFVCTIRSNGKEAYYEIGCRPVEIITFTDSVTDEWGIKWEPGTKFIYFVGERFPQGYADGYQANALLHPQCVSCEYFRGQPCEGGECGPWSCKNRGCKYLYDHEQIVIFTECMPPDSIWEDAGGNVTAIHEPFWENDINGKM